jgi:hypothetical protein
MNNDTPSPPGWYPDQQRPGYRRYWDGTTWGEPVKSKTGFPKWLIPVIACLGLAFLALIAGAVAGDPDPDTAETTTTTTETDTSSSNTSGAPDTTQPPDTTTTAAPTTAAAPTTTAPFTPPGCTPADAGDIATIDATLVDDADHIGNAFVVLDAEGYRYIGATIYDADDERLSFGDLWIIAPDGTLYTASLSAANYSSGISDADTLPGDRGFSEPAGTEATTCNDDAVRGPQ